MKARHDFVSNSSSCSFVVNDGKAAIEVLSSLKKLSYPTSLDGVEFKMFGTRVDLEKIAKSLEIDLNHISLCYDSGFELDSLTFEMVLQLKPSQMKNVSIVARADVYDEVDALFVRLLCKIMQNAGIEVEDVGDYSLSLETENSFLLELFKRAIDGD